MERDPKPLSGSVGRSALSKCTTVRTLEVRVQRASANAELLVNWLDTVIKAGGIKQIRSIVDRVEHASLQTPDLAEQTGAGWVWSCVCNLAASKGLCTATSDLSKAFSSCDELRKCLKLD